MVRIIPMAIRISHDMAWFGGRNGRGMNDEVVPFTLYSHPHTGNEPRLSNINYIQHFKWFVLHSIQPENNIKKYNNQHNNLDEDSRNNERYTVACIKVVHYHQQQKQNIKKTRKLNSTHLDAMVATHGTVSAPTAAATATTTAVPGLRVPIGTVHAHALPLTVPEHPAIAATRVSPSSPSPTAVNMSMNSSNIIDIFIVITNQ